MKYGADVKRPSGVAASDNTGERREKIKGGVAMGKEDMVGADKKFDTGRTAGVCYTHERNCCQK